MHVYVCVCACELPSHSLKLEGRTLSALDDSAVPIKAICTDKKRKSQQKLSGNASRAQLFPNERAR